MPRWVIRSLSLVVYKQMRQNFMMGRCGVNSSSGMRRQLRLGDSGDNKVYTFQKLGKPGVSVYQLRTVPRAIRSLTSACLCMGLGEASW